MHVSHAKASVLLQGNYLEAEAVDVDPVGKTVTCQYSKPFRGQDGAYTGRQFSIPYDVLVVAVGLQAVTATCCAVAAAKVLASL